ncbi:hypothetical protein ASAC_0696 [Acidilobus saccharovorans 345-15]|uniref:Uncharacterized protein n=1 Tax=Acidilobus saccharovorans (strain DSM 16705 / JCM 18335 / VKM B-2471 / 345-15) TaxID=666510 RepID=D9Q1B4_ACIS3|nr:hypothetical protein [Acidilobus saccharovorans]ADL19102.1 hypothetical protein ASAC_0696 [Acidilobus saccharovorans 345-15]
MGNDEVNYAYAAVVIVVSVLGALVVLRYLGPLGRPLPEPPFNVSLVNVSGVGDRLYVNITISDCRVRPLGGSVEVYLGDRVVGYSTFNATCGINTVSLPLQPQLVGSEARFAVNVSLGDRGYVISYFERLVTAVMSLRPVNVTFEDGEPLLFLSYVSPFPVMISAGQVTYINYNLSALALSGCVTPRALAPAGQGTVKLQLLNCSYEDLSALRPGDVYQIRALANVTYISPYGNVTQEVGLLGYQG